MKESCPGSRYAENTFHITSTCLPVLLLVVACLNQIFAFFAVHFQKAEKSLWTLSFRGSPLPSVLKYSWYEGPNQKWVTPLVVSTYTTLCTKTVHLHIYQEARRCQSYKSILPFLAQVTINDASNALYPQNSAGPDSQTQVWQYICLSGTTLHFFLYFAFLRWVLPDQRDDRFFFAWFF